METLRGNRELNVDSVNGFVEEYDPGLLHRVIPGDEKWYYEYDPEIKWQSFFILAALFTESGCLLDKQ